LGCAFFFFIWFRKKKGPVLGLRAYGVLGFDFFFFELLKNLASKAGIFFFLLFMLRRAWVETLWYSSAVKILAKPCSNLKISPTTKAFLQPKVAWTPEVL
jgi:hypothetical protein